jgi:hypothetical protein
MLFRGSVNRSIRWGALLALLLATLAPSVAHALRHLRGDTMPWSQLCSATGAKRVVFDWQGDGSGSRPGAQPFEPCGFCALHHGSWAPPPAAAVVALRADLLALAPIVRLPQTHRSPAWPAALPRAPPQPA